MTATCSPVVPPHVVLMDQQRRLLILARNLTRYSVEHPSEVIDKAVGAAFVLADELGEAAGVLACEPFHRGQRVFYTVAQRTVTVVACDGGMVFVRYENGDPDLVSADYLRAVS